MTASRNGHVVSLLLRPQSSLSRLREIAAGVHIFRFSCLSEITVLLAEIQPDVVLHAAGVYGRDGESIHHAVDQLLARLLPRALRPRSRNRHR